VRNHKRDECHPFFFEVFTDDLRGTTTGPRGEFEETHIPQEKTRRME
jgi:hypothetical protein